MIVAPPPAPSSSAAAVTSQPLTVAAAVPCGVCTACGAVNSHTFPIAPPAPAVHPLWLGAETRWYTVTKGTSVGVFSDA